MNETDTTTETKEPISLESNLNASLEKLFPPATKADEQKAEPVTADADDVEDVEDVSTETSNGEEDEESAPDDDDTPDEEFEAAKEKYNIPTKIDDLPEEARPLVEKKFKDMERGYTRAMQDARSYRTEKAQYDAERAYERDHRDQAIADALVADPSLIDKVNAEIERRKDPTYSKAIERDREVTKREAELTAKETLAQQETRNARGEAIEDYTRDAAKQAGIPFELIESAVVLAITATPGKEFTEAQVDAIIAEKAKVYAKAVGVVKANKTKEYAKLKAEDAKHAGIVKPRSGTGMRSSSDKPAAAKPGDLRGFVSTFVDNFTQ